MTANFTTLKQRQRNDRDNYSDNLGLRVHRALSWLDKAEQVDDLDSKFIFHWIGFNAAYAFEIDDRQRFTEQETFRNFINRLCSLDNNKQLDNLVWNEFSTSIRVLLQNQFVFQPFWDHQNQKIDEATWKEQFQTANSLATKAIGHKNTELTLSVIFARLYTLRNQTMHGGATWNSGVNRDQMRDAVTFLSKFVPIMIEIMMDSPNELWGEATYPVVK